jgi:hypothetical protein
MGKKMGEAMPPPEGAAVEFWTRGMSMQHGASGIPGYYRQGRFVSHDGADYWSGREVHCWCHRATEPAHICGYMQGRGAA